MPPIDPANADLPEPLDESGWAEDARAYNDVVTGWTGIESVSAKVPASVQGMLFGEG